MSEKLNRNLSVIRTGLSAFTSNAHPKIRIAGMGEIVASAPENPFGDMARTMMTNITSLIDEREVAGSRPYVFDEHAKYAGGWSVLAMALDNGRSEPIGEYIEGLKKKTRYVPVRIMRILMENCMDPNALPMLNAEDTELIYCLAHDQGVLFRSTRVIHGVSTMAGSRKGPTPSLG